MLNFGYLNTFSNTFLEMIFDISNTKYQTLFASLNMIIIMTKHNKSTSVTYFSANFRLNLDRCTSPASRSQQRSTDGRRRTSPCYGHSQGSVSCHSRIMLTASYAAAIIRYVSCDQYVDVFQLTPCALLSMHL